MNNIDQTKIETAEQKSAELLEQRIHLVKSECRRRIFEQASATTQTNIIAASSAGLLTEAQKTVWVATLGWVKAMREAWPPLVSDPDAEYWEDDAWPDLPEGVPELMALF